MRLSSLGASITSILIPDYSGTAPQSDDYDDIVLSYKSPKEQLQHNNTHFFSAIVGRVANRIKDGKFQLQQSEGVTTYHLDRNDGNVNHLHGGYDGFCHRIWDAEMDRNQVKFTLTSRDGDQGYPGGIEVTAIYSLVANDDDYEGAKLKLQLHGRLLDGETKATPIALAQHSYFNLASHSSSERILNHVLHMPHCDKFTPLDNTSIPTKRLESVKDVKAMDFCQPRTISDALVHYGEQMVGLTPKNAADNVQKILHDGNIDETFKVPKQGGTEGSNLDGDTPYGFDHNYIIDRMFDDSALRLAAVLSHPPTRRSLSIHTTAPGVQLYTSNYLAGTNPPADICKDNSKYSQWQGICLETQTFPDSIYSTPPPANDEFGKGRCFILEPGGDDYAHEVHYAFGRTGS